MPWRLHLTFLLGGMGLSGCDAPADPVAPWRLAVETGALAAQANASVARHPTVSVVSHTATGAVFEIPGSATIVTNDAGASLNPQERAMVELLLEYETHINDQDAVSFSQIFTEDAVRMGPNSGDQIGREGIRAIQQAAFNTFHFDVSFSIRDVRQNGRWGDGIAFVDAYLTPLSGGSPVHVAFKALFVFELTSEGWLISRQMWNTQPPPA